MAEKAGLASLAAESYMLGFQILKQIQEIQMRE
jgi:hypothetical protein